MGTRADFYANDASEQSDWLGSVAFDGYPDGLPNLEDIIYYSDYLDYVQSLLGEDASATVPAQGWPWPWDDSSGTDFAYKFDMELCLVMFSNFGEPWLPISSYNDQVEFPDMTSIKNIRLHRLL
jgi:hypothetical protein